MAWCGTAIINRHLEEASIARCNELDETLQTDNFESFQDILKRYKHLNNTINKEAMGMIFKYDNSRNKYFYYLLDLPSFTMDNCLRELLWLPFNEYFATELIKKGASLHPKGIGGNTILNTAALQTPNPDIIKVVEFFIKQGMDVDGQNDKGHTPLYIACESQKYFWVYLFLYYNANPNIPSYDNILPLSLLASRSEELQNILFIYTFDSKDSTISLPSMLKLMSSSHTFFSRICHQVSCITYDVGNLEDFSLYLSKAQLANVKLFIERYENVFEDLINQDFFLRKILEKALYPLTTFDIKGILDILLHSNHISELIERHDPTYPTISCLIHIFNRGKTEENEIIKFVCQLLEQGFSVTLTDLNTAYEYYGYGNLFKLLLHMDILSDSEEIVKTDYHRFVELKNSYLYNNRNPVKISGMVRFLYDPTIEIVDCLENPFSEIFDFFNLPIVKKIYLEKHPEALEKVKSLPQVPHLTELSRNAARKFIVEKFKIRKCGQFYSILKWLPIGWKINRIIALEDKLYW